MSTPAFFAVEQLAETLGVGKATVYEWTRQVGPNSVPRYRIGRGYRFLLPEVVEWIRTERDGRLAHSACRRGQVVPVVRRRAPDIYSGGQQVRNAVRTRVSADGSAAVALEVP